MLALFNVISEKSFMNLFMHSRRVTSSSDSIKNNIFSWCFTPPIHQSVINFVTDLLIMHQKYGEKLSDEVISACCSIIIVSLRKKFKAYLFL